MLVKRSDSHECVFHSVNNSEFPRHLTSKHLQEKLNSYNSKNSNNMALKRNETKWVVDFNE